MRVVIADDDLLLREGLERLLIEAGITVVAKAGDPAELLRKVALTRPDVAIVDIKMPPTYTDEGLEAAQEIRASHPETAVLVLSNYLRSRYATRLIDQHPAGVGYLLKERLSDVALLTDALARLTTVTPGARSPVADTACSPAAGDPEVGLARTHVCDQPVLKCDLPMTPATLDLDPQRPL
jgi:DNA-binding NarL/FixJ family response regulator